MGKVAPPSGPLGCREWTGSFHHTGYGQIRFQRTTISAHILAAIAFYGPVPTGREVCHTCDNKRCVNPKHLYFGTDADNVRDRIERGPYLDRHYPRKLTAADVLVIRNWKGTQQSAADHFKVSQANISNIQRRKIWTHI